jgi:hypothetical protein
MSTTSELQVLSTAAFSGMFAFFVSIAATRAIETYGGQRGGLLAALPTTVVPASFGFARVAGLALFGAAPSEARLPFLYASLFTVPGGTLASSLFLVAWRYAPPHLPSSLSFSASLLAMCALSLAVWFLGASVLIAISRGIGNPVAFGLLAFFAQLAAAASVTWRHVDAPKGSAPVPLGMMAMRGVLSGVAIFIAVLLSSVGGDIAAMASAFPAIFMSIQVALWISQGRAVQGGAVGPVMLGVSSVGLYAMLFAASAPALGMLPAMLTSWVASVALASFPAYTYLTWRGSVAAQGQEPAQVPGPAQDLGPAAPAQPTSAALDAPLHPVAASGGGSAGWDEGELPVVGRPQT